MTSTTAVANTKKAATTDDLIKKLFLRNIKGSSSETSSSNGIIVSNKGRIGAAVVNGQPDYIVEGERDWSHFAHHCITVRKVGERDPGSWLHTWSPQQAFPAA
jgi:hypothetical protein